MSDLHSQLAASKDLITQNGLQRIIAAASELIDEGDLTDEQSERIAAIQADAEKILRAPKNPGDAGRFTAQVAEDHNDFLSVVAHELRTPLTSLRGFAQTGLRQMVREGSIPPERIRQILESIDQQAERLTQLLAQFREYSRLEAGRLVLDCKPTELVGLVESIALVTATTLDKIIVKSQTPVIASVDALRLRQVLTYFIEAALKSSPTDQWVAVEVSSPNDLAALITIFDHGGEVLPEQRDHLTREDVQIRGADLDLHISRQIIGLHKGRLYVEFPPDGGTRLTISLPVV